MDWTTPRPICTLTGNLQLLALLCSMCGLSIFPMVDVQRGLQVGLKLSGFT